MNRFARLAESLAFMASDAGKRRLIADYMATTPGPARGWGMAVLLGAVPVRCARPAVLRTLAARRTDPALFALSHGFVGDVAETLALMWPDPPPRANSLPPSMDEVVPALLSVGRTGVEDLLEGWLDTLDATGRYTLLKLAAGSLKLDITPRLVVLALAAWGGVDVHAVEECRHGLTPPYEPLFAWLERRGPRPAAGAGPVFRPFMPAAPLDGGALDALDPARWAAEWQWDGLRVQLVAAGGGRAIYGRDGADLTAAFPDVVETLDRDGAVEGEILAAAAEGPPFTPAPAALLGPRLKRTARGRAVPVFVRLFDMLADDGEDLRPMPLSVRRARLERWAAARSLPWADLSPLLPLTEARRLHAGMAGPGVRGMMLKRWDAPYDPAGAGGAWLAWKRATRSVRAVLMYAQRAGGPGGGGYESYTAGVWRDGALVPLGKAAAALPADERRELDRWITAATTNRFGPVREVAPGLVVTVEFDGITRSGRTKCGLSLRGPRITSVLWTTPAEDAAPLTAVAALTEE